MLPSRIPPTGPVDTSPQLPLEMAHSGQHICGRRHDSGMVCTRELGHPGPHVAHGGIDNPLQTWHDEEIVL